LPVAGWFHFSAVKRYLTFLARLELLNLTPGWPPLTIVVISPLFQSRKIYRVFLALLLFALLLGTGFPPALLTQARTMTQAETAYGLTLTVTGPAAVNTGDTFEIQALLDNPSPAGIFGYQFGLTWNSAAVAPVDPAPTLNPEFSLIAQNEITPGQFTVIASRQGDVPDLPGALTLLTWRFQALTPTGSDPARFELIAATLGQKDGTELPLEGNTPLAVLVVEPAPLRGSLAGTVQLEGRAPGSGGSITLLINELGLTAAPAPGGDFAFPDLNFGSYTLTASSPGFLRADCRVDHNGASTTLAGVTLLAGDLTDDAVIDVADATALGLAIGRSDLSIGADLNTDGAVNVLDLILLAVNFGQSAGSHPWLCQP
jgi:hypothetical protein